MAEKPAMEDVKPERIRQTRSLQMVWEMIYKQKAEITEDQLEDLLAMLAGTKESKASINSIPNKPARCILMSASKTLTYGQLNRE